VDLVRRAKQLGLNLSEVVETAIEVAIRDRERTAWLAENQQAIRQYNAFVDEHGVFSDDWRAF
jgi:antitoxin CcdA